MRNESLNNTCILFDKEDEAQQKAIIKFYNDGGYPISMYLEISDDECVIGINAGDLGYWYNGSESMQVIELPSEYYPKIVESALNIDDLMRIGEIRDSILRLVRTTDIGETLIEEMLKPIEKILTDNHVNLKDYDV